MSRSYKTKYLESQQTIDNLVESIGLLHRYIAEIEDNAEIKVKDRITQLQTANERLTVEIAALRDKNTEMRRRIYTLVDAQKASRIV